MSERLNVHPDESTEVDECRTNVGKSVQCPARLRVGVQDLLDGRDDGGSFDVIHAGECTT